MPGEGINADVIKEETPGPSRATSAPSRPPRKQLSLRSAWVTDAMAFMMGRNPPAYALRPQLKGK